MHIKSNKKNILKLIPLLLILLYLLLSSSTIYAVEEIQNSNAYLVEYSLESGEIKTRNYPTTENSNEIHSTDGYISENTLAKTREIINIDTRGQISNTSIYPYSTICLLESTFQDGTISRGTAFMIYSNYAYTAGHCVVSQEHGIPTSIRVIPGKSGDSEPFGTAWATNIECDSRWVNDFNSEEDWAVLTLNWNIGNSCSWLPIACSDDYTYFETNHEIVSIIGYPKPITNNSAQYIGYGNVMRATGLHLYYDVDTESGQSGSPVIQGDSCAIGIHTGAETIDGVRLNKCSNITRARFNGILSKMNGD